MSVRTKNPLHPSALRINDLNPGRRIILFNVNLGDLGEFIVVHLPEVRFIKHMGKQYVVDLRSVRSGGEDYHYLSDMGVIPAHGSWSKVNFAVDSKKRDLLPTVSAADARSYL